MRLGQRPATNAVVRGLMPTRRAAARLEAMRLTVTPAELLRYRARASGLGEKQPSGSLAVAAWGGLQDSVPRSGVLSLHARTEDVEPDSWEDASLVQIWFRGADYIVPRADVGVFTLGTYPRDTDRGAALERIADDIHRVTAGRTLRVAEVTKLLGHERPLPLRHSSITGRTHIRWDARDIWLIPVERPDIDVEDARRALARRFLHWYGPATTAMLARWTGVKPADARATWKGIEEELVPLDLQGEHRFMLAADLEALEQAEPISGVRLLPMDDPYTKYDRALLVPDASLRDLVLPPYGLGPGYAPGAVLVDGEIVGGWERQGRALRIHPFPGFKPASRVREAIDQEALNFPIASSSPPGVSWV